MTYYELSEIISECNDIITTNSAFLSLIDNYCMIDITVTPLSSVIRAMEGGEYI